jgi:hypothetical protein
MILHVRPMKSRACLVLVCLCNLWLCACRQSGDEGTYVPVAEGSAKTKLNLRRPNSHASQAEISGFGTDLSNDTTQTVTTQTVTTQTL